MRIQPWMTAVTGALVLVVAQAPTSAQTPGGGGPSYYGAPIRGYETANPDGYYPSGQFPPPSAPGGPADPSTLWPPGTPQSYQPWPQISPYHSPNVRQDQHYNSNGLWFRELFYRRRDTFFSVEAMAVYFRDAGNATIGSPYAYRYDLIEDFLTGGFQDPNDGPYVPSPNVDPPPSGIYVVDPRVVPVPALASDAGVYNDAANFYLYPIRSGNNLSGGNVAPGLQARMGFMNEDYTGASANVWWAFETGSEFRDGFEFINGVRVNQAITAGLEGQNLSTLNGNIPLNNGETLTPYFGPGSMAKYDVFFGMKTTTQAGGANFSIYQQPFYRNDGVMLRPLWGMRYMYIAEGFRFRGIDSGFNYTVDATTLRPENDSLVRLYDQYEARLASDVQSHLAGPELGFRFDLGGRNSGFKMWGETILGINANNEQIHLRGDNIGDPLVDVRFGGFAIPRILDNANFDSEFDERKTNTHVSPLFQQSVFADMALMDVIPGVRKMTMFEDTTFRVGYTFTWVGGVARPLDAIDWQGFPLKPEIQSNRQSWWTHQLSASIDWHF